MKYLLLLLLLLPTAPLMAQSTYEWTSSWPQGWAACEVGQFVTKNGECLLESRRTADNAKCPAGQYATAYGTCDRDGAARTRFGTADATIWDYPAQTENALYISDDEIAVSHPSKLYVYTESSANPLLTCKMPTQDTAADCKLADGVTLDQLMTEIFQSEQRAGEQWMADVDAANKRTQQCVNIAENLIGHPRAKSRKKKGGK